jgi:8-oxo-dGTP pyrophosphatase MutT (NUDIX family)
MTSDLLLRLQDVLSGRTPTVVTEWAARPAAVLVPLLEEGGEWHLLFTLRTDSVETHRGQVSFPGGGLEPDDADPVAAALREANEEIGLLPSDVQVIGRMDALMTVTQYLITPVVGIILAYRLQPHPNEVAAVFHVPLAWLADPANLETRLREPLAGGPPVPVYSYRPYQGHILWGASARITLDLLRLAGLRPD